MSKVLKVYEWGGADPVNLVVNISGKITNLAFSPGKEKPKVNAQYETSDQNVQDAIENCHLFKVGQLAVKYSKTLTDIEVAATNPTRVSVSATQGRSYPSVTTLQQAADKLVEKFGLSPEELQMPEAILAKAEEYQAKFPNLIY